MQKSSQRIRLRYSTIINYLSMIYKLAVSIGFVIIVARKLSITEFALWGIIVSISNMLASFTLFWRYWSQRLYARGDDKAAGTGFITTILFWVPALLLYLGFSVFENSVLGYGLYYMLLGIPYILLTITNSYLNSLADVSKPELRGYSGFLYETTRLLLSFLLVAILKQKLDGALISIEIAMGLSVVFLIYNLSKQRVLSLTFSKNLLIGWLKNFHVPLVTMLNSFLRNGIRAIVSWITGNETVVAYLNIGLSSEGPLLQTSQSASPALYAKLLRKDTGSDITTSLRIFLIFSGFLLATFLTLSKTIASVFNPEYVKIHWVIPGVSIYAFLLALAILYETILKGVEKIDVSRIPTPKEVIHSNLFKAPLARLISTISSIILMFILLKTTRITPEMQAYVITIALIIGALPLTIYLSFKAKHKINYEFPFKEAITVIIAGIVIAGYYLIVGTNQLLVTSFWAQAPILVSHLLIATILYMITLYILSPWTRELIREGVRTIAKTSKTHK